MPNRERKICVLLGALHHRPQTRFPHGRTPHDIEISRWADYLQDLLTTATDETCIAFPLSYEPFGGPASRVQGRCHPIDVE